MLRALVLSFLVVSSSASVADAQRRVIQFSAMDECMGRPLLPVDWIVTPPDPCPGATLARICGVPPVAGTCASVEQVGASIDDAALDRCAADAALLPAANALFDEAPDVAGLLRAERLYAGLARVPALRSLALYRAGVTAWRLSRYPEAAAVFAQLLSAERAGPVHDAAVERYGLLVATSDFDEDQQDDPDFPEARFVAPILPDAPWARAVAVRALRWILDGCRAEAFPRALELVRHRWPVASSDDLDELESEWLERTHDDDELVVHVFAAASRCHARHAACERGFLDRAERLAVRDLGECGVTPQGTDAAQRLQACLSGVAIGERLLALRPSAPLALDVADAAVWAGGTLARSSAQIAVAASHDATVRADANRLLAAPLAPAPPPLRAHASPALAAEGQGSVDEAVVQRAASNDALRPCAPNTAAAVGVQLAISTTGTVTSVELTGAAASSTCLTRVFRALHVPPAFGGEITIRGIVLFPPTPAPRHPR